MKRVWKKRIITTFTLVIALLTGIAIFPGLVYARKTSIGPMNVFHQTTLPAAFSQEIDNALNDVSKCELYDPESRFEICLDDGSIYPRLLRTMTGDAFARGFANKVVVMGKIDHDGQQVTLNGWSWDLEQLIAHELMHCLQFKRYGLLHSNPLAGHADWKWEGYPEYVARRHPDQIDLAQNLARKLKQDKEDPGAWAYRFQDGTISPRKYYDAWLLMQYCLDVEKLTFDHVLADKTSEDSLWSKMMHWHERLSK